MKSQARFLLSKSAERGKPDAVCSQGLSGMVKIWATAFVTAAAAASGVAEASVDQIKIGVAAHNVALFGEQNAKNEGGANVNVQVNLKSPGFLRWAGAPRPYLYGSANLEGATNFGGAGLAWRIPLGEKWALEPALGYVVHDGAIDLPYPAGSPENQQYSDDNVLFGSRDLFQTSLGISRKISAKVSAEFYYEHLSHGQILGEGRNQGLDNFGVRIGYGL